MTEPDRRCQCLRYGPEAPCSFDMTAEDLLCDECRASQCGKFRRDEIISKVIEGLTWKLPEDTDFIRNKLGATWGG